MTNIKRILEAASGVSTATDYQLMSWGKGGNGTLGLGNTTNYSSPKNVGSADPWTKISATVDGATTKPAVGAVKNGKLFTWGKNQDGKLGLGNTTEYSSPKQVGALTTWEEVAMGGVHCLAVKKDGTLWAWGDGSVGELGLGNTTDYSSPKQVGSLTDWSKVSASGDGRSAAIKTDGTLWTWGRGSSGVLGHGNTSNKNSPTQVGSLTNWAEVDITKLSCVAVKTDGTLWTWGDDGNGQMGHGSPRTDLSSPKQVGALTDWATPANGSDFMACVKTDGTLWTWGNNASYGVLGLGNTTSYSSPKQVGSLTDWSKPAACNSKTMGCIKTDGTLWMWGAGGYGTLGLGNGTDYSSPKQVGSLTSWKALAIGYRFSALAFYEP